MKTFNEFRSQIAEQGQPTGIKLYHTDKEGKESHTVVFTPRDAQQREKEVKKAGGKTTHRAVMYGKKEGEKVAVKEETDLAEIEEGVIQRSGTDKITETTKFVNGANPHGHTFGAGAVRHDLSNIKPKKQEPQRDMPVADIDPDWEKEQAAKRQKRSVSEGSVPAERNRPALSASDRSTLGRVADLMAKEKAKKKEDLPFTPDKPHAPVAKAGKYGMGYSTARHLARQGMKDVQKEETSNDGWYKTGKEAKHIKTGETTYEYEKYKDGKGTGERHYRNAAGKVMGEEVEQIDELSKKTLGNYIKKATSDAESGVAAHAYDAGREDESGNYKRGDKANARAAKRVGGIEKAVDRLTKEETKMSQMDKYLAAISGNADFRTSLEEKTLTPAELKKREEIAQAIERENPDMPMSKKMAIATAQAKKVAEEVELEEAISDADKETMKKRAAMARPELEKTKDVTRKFGGGEKGAKNVEQGFRSAIKRDYKKMDEEVVEEGKAHTVPKTEKEKDLAALAEPKDKITHADVLKGRGVTKEDVEQIDELSKDTLKSYVGKALGSTSKRIGDKDKDLGYRLNNYDRIRKNAAKGTAQALLKLSKEETELEESPKEGAPRKFSGMYDKGHGGRTEAEKKALKDAAKSINDRSKQQMAKEGVELKTFSQLMAELDEAKKDDYWDFKDLKDEPKSTTRKVAGTRYGGSAQKDEPEEDHEDDNNKPAVKRGRGRPAGSKSGARH